MGSIKYSPFAVHLAFSTYPLGQVSQYINNIEKVYETYKDTMMKCEPDKFLAYTYKPKKYHLFGHYDILFLSIIESYRFALKVFSYSENGYDAYRTIDYQIQTGTALDFEKSDFDYEEVLLNNNFKYINISNLKINNNLIIGLGSAFLTPVVQLMKEIIESEFNKDELSFVILNGYNWADLTLILLSDDPSKLAEVIIKLRELNVEDMLRVQSDIEQLIKGYSLQKGRSELYQHIFIDTQSILGIDFDFFQSSDPEIVYQHFSSQIEWDVKPGHITTLLESLKITDEVLQLSSFRNGKTDFVTNIVRPGVPEDGIHEPEKTFSRETKILNALKENEAILGKHIQKLKTVPLFDFKESHIGGKKQQHADHTGWLSPYKIENISEILVAANNLKLSRQLRMKIEKIFYNYNNSISDSISFIYFIDFRPFLEFFRKEILNESNRIINLYKEPYNHDSIRLLIQNEEMFKISSLEIKYEKIINAFEEAYMDRVLNNYNYEDINDFNIDLNVNNTKLISTNDMLVKIMSPLLFDNERKMLVRQNELNTVSNIVSINYNVFHLFEPHLIFNTIVKEICNNFLVNIYRDPGLSKKFEKQIKKLEKVRDQIQQDIKNINSTEIKAEDIERVFKQFDLLYFETDVLKYFYTFNSNTKLYVFWSWLYYIQNTSLHSTNGTFVLENLTKEMIRILFVVGTFDPEYLSIIDCPFPELKSFWISNFYKLREAISEIKKLGSFQNLVQSIITIYKDHTLVNDYNSSRETPLIRDFFEEIFTESRNKELCIRLNNNDWNKYNDYLVDHRYEDRFAFRWKHLEIFAEKYSDDFINGNPVIFDESKMNPSLYFNCISYLTLNWYFGQLKGELKILPRDRIDGSIQIEKIKRSSEVFAFIDPQGGLFIINPENRKKSMRFTHSVHHVLWHLSMNQKRHLFTNP